MQPVHSILIVDDNPAIHDDFRKLWGTLDSSPVDDLEASIWNGPATAKRTEHFEFVSALQGQEALAKVQAAKEAGRPFSVAFVDGRMPPGWDGLETIGRLREADPDLQVVLCTAYSDHSWEDMRQRLGRSDSLLVLKKPFDTVEALQIIDALTRKWELAREVRSALQDLDRKVQERTAALEREMAERSRAEADLRHVQKLEAVGQLAAGIAHDFNNLMTVIQGNAELILMERAGTPDSSETIQRILSAARRAATLTRQLLVFGRKQVARPKPVDLNEAVTEALTLLRRLLGANIRIQVSPCAEPVRLLADDGNLCQVIINLAMNARDAMPEGGVLSFRTAIETLDGSDRTRSPHARQGVFASLTVSDTGCGMDTATLSRIFEPFFTTKEAGRGTGIGLATVWGIVRQHGGWIEVGSQLGHGSTFKIFLPRLEDTPAANLPPPADLPPPPPREPRPETILVVEDEPGVREFVRKVLERGSFKILEAVDGMDALRIWAQHGQKVDLLFTDMVMPNGLSGRRLADRLRSERADLKVILTSGYSAEAPETAPPNASGYDFLPKPFTAEALLRAVEERLAATPGKNPHGA